MDVHTAKRLCKITNDFYQNQCESFSATRTSPWLGWKKCLDIVQDEIKTASAYETHANSGDNANASGAAIFDLACGNLRFASFLADSLPKTPMVFYAVDTCDDLLPQSPLPKNAHINYQSLDVLDVLTEGVPLHEQIEAPTCDISVSFGFMHHVPTKAYREEILSSLITQTRSGGYAIVSFWQFLKSESLRAKAQATHELALQELKLEGLEEHDYLLGWKSTPGAYRYCHSFSEAEIDSFIDLIADRAALVSRFTADGKSENLNTYLVFRVR